MSVTVSAVKAGEHTYSCNCGWIDHAHGSMDRTQPETEHRLDVMENWKQFPVTGHTGKRSPGGRGWIVNYVPAVGIVSSNLLPLDFPHRWFVRDLGGNLDAYRGVALRLYQLGNERMEEIQENFDRIKHSSFSYEDLPSNTIAWYRGVMGLKIADVDRECQVVTRAESEALAAAIDVDKIKTKNHDWTKALLFNDKCEPCRKRGQTASGFQLLPEVFRKVTPGHVTRTPGVGDAWPYIHAPVVIPVPVPPLPLPVPVPFPLILPFIRVPIPPGLLPIPPGPAGLNPRYPPWDDPSGDPAAARSPGRADDPLTRFAGLNSRGRVPGPLSDEA
jgi:hypothetical protein